MIERGADGSARQRDDAVGGRVGRHHVRRQDGADLVDLVRLAEQDLAVGGGLDALAARAAPGDIDGMHRGQVDHREAAGAALPKGVLGAVVVGHEEQAVQLGAKDFLQKPWENERLLSIVRNQIELRAALKGKERLEADCRR